MSLGSGSRYLPNDLTTALCTHNVTRGSRSYRLIDLRAHTEHFPPNKTADVRWEYTTHTGLNFAAIAGSRKNHLVR